MNIIGKQQQIGILGVLLRNKDIPLWVIDAYVAKFEEISVQSDVNFTAKRNGTLSVLGLPTPKIEIFSDFNTPDTRALADATWLRLLKQPPSTQTLESLNLLLIRNGEIPAYFRRMSWTYLTARYTAEAEAVCKKILANPLKNKLPENVTSASSEVGYYDDYRKMEDGTTLSSDILIPIDLIYQKEGHVWSVFYVRGNRLLMADAHRTFRELKLFEPESPLFPSFCDVLVAVISSSKTPYVQGLTYLCGITLLYSRTLHEAVGIALRITQASNVYRTFILMEKERINTVCCTLVKMVSIVLGHGMQEGNNDSGGGSAKITNLFKKKKVDAALKLAYYGFTGYENQFDAHTGRQPFSAAPILFKRSASNSGATTPRSASRRVRGSITAEDVEGADTDSPSSPLFTYEPIQELLQMVALHRKIQLQALSLFQSNFDVIFNVTSAVASSCVLTVFSKVSFEISLFAMDYLSYTEKLDEAIILLMVALIVTSIAQTAITINARVEATQGYPGEEVWGPDEISEEVIKALTKITVPIHAFIGCLRDVTDLFKKSEHLQHQMQTFNVVFNTINDD